MPKIKQSSTFQSVHWYSKEEWTNVFDLTFGPNSNEKTKKEALQKLLVWKSRNPYLPSGIESTLGLLEVEMQASLEQNTAIPDRLLRLMYSSVIMRFINHTLDSSQSKRLTLLRAAAEFDIPQWIIDLRHESAHGHEIPSLEVFQNAANFAINWLHKAYWLPQLKKISNYEIKEYSSNFRDDLYKLLSLHNLLVMCRYPSFKMEKIIDIPDEEMRKNLLMDLKSIIKSNQLNKKMSLATASQLLIDVISTFLKKIDHIPNHGKILADLLVDSESLFMAHDVINQTEMESFNGHKLLPQKWIVLWQPLLSLMHRKKIVSILFNELLSIVANVNESRQKRERAAQWIREISIGLNKSHEFKAMIKNQPYDCTEESNDFLINMLLRKQPGLKGISLDLQSEVPPELNNIEFIERALMQIHPYLNLYAKELINLLQPKLPKSMTQKLIELVQIVTNKTVENPSCDQIYTMDDVRKFQESNEPNIHTDMEVDSSFNFNKRASDLNRNEHSSKWIKVSDDHDWSLYPIGTLPWQINMSNNPCYL